MMPVVVREASKVVTDWLLTEIGPAQMVGFDRTAELHQMQASMALRLVSDDNRARTDVPEAL